MEGLCIQLSFSNCSEKQPFSVVTLRLTKLLRLCLLTSILPYAWSMLTKPPVPKKSGCFYPINFLKAIAVILVFLKLFKQSLKRKSLSGYTIPTLFLITIMGLHFFMPPIALVNFFEGCGQRPQPTSGEDDFYFKTQPCCIQSSCLIHVAHECSSWITSD